MLYQNLMITANQTSTINSLTHTKRNPNTVLKVTREKNKRKRRKKTLQKKSATVNKMAIRTIYIDNYLKCKWIKHSNQKKYIGQMD